jgi:hypothetical protein
MSVSFGTMQQAFANLGAVNWRKQKEVFLPLQNS